MLRTLPSIVNIDNINGVNINPMTITSPGTMAYDFTFKIKLQFKMAQEIKLQILTVLQD